MKTEFFNGLYDAAKWSVSDFYDESRELLDKELKSDNEFDTGWYSVKKEIQSGRVIRVKGTVLVEASVSDDFDTPGYGAMVLPYDCTIDNIVESLDEALDEANENLKENANYCGFSIGSHENGKLKTGIYTLILPTDDSDYPGGDNYYEWGWQEETPDISAKCKNVLDRFAHDYIYNVDNTRNRIIKHGITCGKWMIRPWNHDDE